MSVSRSNSTVILQVAAPEFLSSSENDVIFSTPRTCWMAASSGAVTNASITSGEALGHWVCTLS